MTFDIPLNIESKIHAFACAHHLSANDAVVRLIEAGLKLQPASELGSIDEGREHRADTVLIDDAVMIAIEERRRPSTRIPQ
ncbi:hypothetical protein [Fimbriimonas ginsengisoli]|uniref:hypothetical protein n=1 Tax=Fimbriimonas ginsengisoli TaxID=1005039 RepID=UPI00046D5B33|nr:hypothetical protein [Fimbriimonas ginsengisoli]